MDEIIINLLEKAHETLVTHKQEEQSGKYFNVLDICQVGTIETRHTEIIAALLDPHGNHGLGTESLKAFFRQCSLPDFADHCEDCNVQTEVKIPGRRLDIVIRGKAICVIIENKTNTSDHYMQLADYRRWLNEQSATYKALLYLTYGGFKASEEINENAYQRISYVETIFNWLQLCTCMRKNSAANFCGQYADFIKKTIIGEGTMNNTVTKIILHDIDCFRAAACINKNFNIAKNEIFKKIIKECIDDNVEIYFGTNGFGLDIYPEKSYRIGFQWDNKCYYGIPRKEQKITFEKLQLENFLPSNNWWIAYKYIESEEFNCNWSDPDFLATQWEKDEFEAFKDYLRKCIAEVKNVIENAKKIS